MKKIIFCTVLALSAIISVFSISFSCDNTIKYNRLSAASSNKIALLQTRVSELEYKTSCFAVLKEHNGIIGVFDGNEKYLIGTINVSVKTLPEADRKMLYSGIKIKTAEDLISLFEDFSS